MWTEKMMTIVLNKNPGSGWRGRGGGRETDRQHTDQVQETTEGDGTRTVWPPAETAQASSETAGVDVHWCLGDWGIKEYPT